MTTVDLLQAMLSSFVSLIPVTLAQSLMLSFIVLGIMLPFRLLNFPDMTCEGTYPLGGCVCATMMASGMSPVPAMAVATLCGFAAGCATAYIHLRFKIHTLLAGILMMTMLYSINLRIMGRSNLSIYDRPSLFEALGMGNVDSSQSKIAITTALVIIVLLLLNWFFRTEKGIAMRAVGVNPEMSAAQGINIWTATIVGVGLASGFAALSATLMVQSQGFADVNMGLGILVNGLAALMIGEAIVGTRRVWQQLLAPFVGSVAYYQIVSVFLAAGMPPPDLKLITGLFVLLMLALPTLRSGTRQQSFLKSR